MKTFSRIIVTLPLLVGLTAIPTISSASETRVQATGGLIAVLPDETTDLNLFLDGNPAGLVLLNSRSRMDLSGEWADSNQDGSWGSASQNGGGFFFSPRDPVIRYGGLLLFPSSHWAFQTAGGLSSLAEIPTAGSGAPSLTESQYQGLARVSYAFSFAALGVEIRDLRSDGRQTSGFLAPAEDLIGSSSGQNQFQIKTGVAAAFPSPALPQEPRWLIGGFFAFPAGSSSLSQVSDLSENNSPPFRIQSTTTSTLYNRSGIEVLYEVPASLKLHFSASLQNNSSDFEQTVSAPSTFFIGQPRSHLSDSRSVSLEGSFRCSIPFSEDENLKLGGSLGFQSDDLLTFNGAPDTFHQRQVDLLWGVGFEEVKEYTMGLQWKSRDYLSGSRLLPETPLTTGAGADFYQLTFGGEKWISPTWAARLGFVLEQDDAFAGSLSTLTTSINAGAGWEQVFGRVDFRFNLGQTLDTGNSGNTIGLFGAGLSTTFFL